MLGMERDHVQFVFVTMVFRHTESSDGDTLGTAVFRYNFEAGWGVKPRSVRQLTNTTQKYLDSLSEEETFKLFNIPTAFKKTMVYTLHEMHTSINPAVKIALSNNDPSIIQTVEVRRDCKSDEGNTKEADEG